MSEARAGKLKTPGAVRRTGTMTESREEEVAKGLFEGIIEALTDKNTRMEIEFRNLSVKLPGVSSALELSGNVILSVRMSDPPPPRP